MNILLKWSLIFAVMVLAMEKSHAWNVGSKSSVSGPAIHTTYFLTPNNAESNVRAYALVGNMTNGICQTSGVPYNLGVETIRTGDTVEIDAGRLKSIIGLNSYNDCMQVYYINKQAVTETFALSNDGINYIKTQPAKSEITII